MGLLLNENVVVDEVLDGGMGPFRVDVVSIEVVLSLAGGGLVTVVGVAGLLPTPVPLILASALLISS